MKLKLHPLLLLAIFLIVFVSRAFISLQTGQFSDDRSYFVLRQVEDITETGLPIFHDNLSYGGRTLLFSPLFYYVLAMIYFLFPGAIALKIFLNLAASTLVFASYLISMELTKSRKISLFIAFISGFIPVYFAETVNALSIFSLMIPLTFFSLYYLMRLNHDKRYANHFLLVLFSLILLSPASIILIIGLLFFLLLLKLEKIKVSRINVEVVLVSTFLYLWFNFILFKRAILFHGPQVIWQNVPKTYLFQYFANIDIIREVYLIGIIPFVLGIYAAYVFIVRQKSVQTYMIIGVGLSLFFLLWFRLVTLKAGLIFLGVVLVILLSQYFNLFSGYISKTRAARYKALFFAFFFVAIIITSVLPSITLGLDKLGTVPANSTLEAYAWLEKNTGPEDTVLTSETEGHALTFFAKRKSVMDDNFLFVKNIDQRLFDIRRIYITRFSQEAAELAKKYGIDYILVDEEVKKNYGVDELAYSGQCFLLVADGQVKIYEVICKDEI